MTDGNKAEYVSAKARLILVGSREPALEALKGGFAGALRDLSPGAAPFMGLLSHADWRVLLCGEEHVSGPQVHGSCDSSTAVFVVVVCLVALGIYLIRCSRAQRGGERGGVTCRVTGGGGRGRVAGRGK